MISDQAFKKLKNIVGLNHCSRDLEDLYVYSFDMTEESPGNPDGIVMPGNVEEIQKVIEICNEYKIPVIPYIAGANIGGLTITHNNGLIVDLRRLNKVIKHDEHSKYVVMEPGVTFGHLKTYLAENMPDFQYSYAIAPPYTSVVANALLEGLTEYSFRWGAMGDWITGIEAVLPTGEVAKVGSCATSDKWWGRYPLPDMIGLFVGWQGMTGIVTKMGVKVVPEPITRQDLMIIYNDFNSAPPVMRKIANSDLIHGGYGVSYEAGQMALGLHHPLPPKKESEPDFIHNVMLFANSKDELKLKFRFIKGIVEEQQEKDSTRISVSKSGKDKKMLNLPAQFPGLLDHRSGDKHGVGLTWLGTYSPLDIWPEYYTKGYNIMKGYGFTPIIWIKMMDSAHFTVVRFIAPFDKTIPSEVKDVRKMLLELTDVCLDFGAIPYKCPAWAAEKVLARADPGYKALFKRVKLALDPNNIMNPERWAFDKLVKGEI